jgi:hypothetical protein
MIFRLISVPQPSIEARLSVRIMCAPIGLDSIKSQAFTELLNLSFSNFFELKPKLASSTTS